MSFYFQLGFQHIIDWAALDHILFLLVLCATYSWQDWKRLLWLITAFTIGHCLTLVLAGTDLIRISAYWVEIFIPATIVLGAIGNLIRSEEQSPFIAYSIILFFGLIHGLGFSNTFRAMLFPGEENQLIGQLLGFNLGVELGQILVVAMIMVVTYFFTRVLKIPAKYWQWGLSLGAGIVGFYLLVLRL
ncbi:MAG: HupE/UreJ family protein [Bacteroidota bacterium]